LLFQFKSIDINKLEKYLKPKTSGANISPFSSRNLPKNNSYNIPKDEIMLYQNIVEKIGKNHILNISHVTKKYLKTLVDKNCTLEFIKSDMAKKGLSNKNYIHSIGKWSDYIRYLKKELL